MSSPTITVSVVYGVGSRGSRIAATFVNGVGPGGRQVYRRLQYVKAACVSSSRLDILQLSAFQPNSLYVIGDGTSSAMNPDKGRKDYLDSSQRKAIVEEAAKAAEEKGYDRIDVIPVVVTLGFGCGFGAGSRFSQKVSELMHHRNMCTALRLGRI
ncbi:MAG: hypothetical protein QXJ73_07875 [Candidatus Caldarchaeum sp.]